MTSLRVRTERLISVVLCAVLLAILAVFAPPAADSAAAADLTQFRAGNIISDSVFFNATAMSEPEVDAFLRAQVPKCQSGYTCLKDFRQSTSSRAADRYCDGYVGAPDEPAARIIVKVAQSCRVNPQVLLVVLQKEQGLVTHTWPSDWRYTIAMGQACPDTAGCDSRYYGFTNQVYGAARQFNVYAEGKYFTYYAPGKTWNIQFNPNKACGSAPVYIENVATAGLYYYTPYQPNKAALAAGSGTGDSCSAYGNRNFYRYFVDWFGSTQQTATRLLRADGDSAVYLVSNGSKYHVRTFEDLLAFQSRLGSVVQVSATYISRFPTAQDVSRYIHDARAGILYLLEADGTRHRFANADQVRMFGYEFSSYVNLEPAIIDKFARGADVNQFVRISNASAVYQLDRGTLRYVPSMEVWRRLAGSTGLYAASMDAVPAAKLPRGTAVLPNAAMVREADKPDVFMVSSPSSLTYVRNLAVPADLGIREMYVVPAGTLGGYSRSATELGPIVACGMGTYVASGGSTVKLTGDASSTKPVALPSCGPWESAAPATAPLFVTITGGAAVYEISGGVLRHVTRYEDLLARNGDRPLTVLTWSAASAERVGFGAPILVDGQFVQFSDNGMVYLVSSGSLRYVPTYAKLMSLTGGKQPVIVKVDAALRSQLVVGPPLDVS